MFLKKAALLLSVLLALSLGACAVPGEADSSSEASSGPEKTRYQAEFLQVFDTITQVLAFTETKEEFDALSTLIYEELQEYHKLYDIYNSYEGVNNVKTINDNAGIAPVQVDQRIIDMLLYSKEMYEESGGLCNVALGPVLKIWHNYRERGIDDPFNAKLPEMDALEAASAFTDINKVIIDEEASTVFLEEPEMSLDVGAIAKGYATEQVCQTAMAAGYNSALVSVGGNVRAIGYRDGESELWNVGVQNPDRYSEESLLLITTLHDTSLVTSGDYQRYFTVDGVEYHHIIDPETLMPARHVKMVSIVCEDSGYADALSTAVFNMPYEEGYSYVESLPGVEALWVLNDGEIKYSGNFESLVKKD